LDVWEVDYPVFPMIREWREGTGQSRSPDRSYKVVVTVV
jgi:hypothetical protein